MKLGVMSALFANMSLDEALDYCASVGLDAIELPFGGYPGDPWKLRPVAHSSSKAKELLSRVKDRGLEISALSVHGNPLHPDARIARSDHADHRNAVQAAKMLGVEVVINFSGCPGGSERDRTPNWVTCAWPDDFAKLLDWQWKKKVVPYWKREAKFAADRGVKIAFEAHPGFVVYNTETLLRLREACGANLGANLDPSHLFWQGIDPVESARVLGQAGAIFHVHAKDTGIDPRNSSVNGNLDTKSYALLTERSWVFRTVGYGHGDEFWCPFISMLARYGYDGVLSIEHEDSLMSPREGFEKAVEYLKRIILREKPGKAWWF